MKGIYPVPYFRNPKVDKPIEEIWDDIDAYTGEFFGDETDGSGRLDLFVLIPPLKYEGKFVKGLIMTQGAGWLINKYPDIQNMFLVGAYTMWSNYSWSDKADVYFACYENKARENYHKNKYQKKKNIIFIPLQDADFTNEYQMAPAYNIKKEYDLIAVCTPYEVKNHIMIAKALIAYEKLYKKRLKAKFIFGIDGINKYRDGELEYSKVSYSSRNILDKINEILGNDMKKYVEIIPKVYHYDLHKEYSGAKCLVLASLIEGKNRSLNEAMSCNTPIVTFREHNQWARGDYPIFFGSSGELAEEFTPESLALAIHKIISNPQNYKPRENYLKYNGRKNFINTCGKYIPYYRENIPNFDENMFWNNLWVDLACQNNYQMSYLDFLYGKNYRLSWVQGESDIDFLIKYYKQLFGFESVKEETC